ncbi:Phosphotyrosyl phosphatase activator [Gautieria morchelliformis]|nr:Phosphotyrosyl phosphatase activator [Gautieria morchelliformis]
MAISSYHVPRKAILTTENLKAFQESETYVDIVNYIETLNESILGVKLSDDCSVSPGVDAILVVLNKVEQVAKNTPPVNNSGSRFGNPAFKTFYDKVAELAPSLHSNLPGFPHEATPEVSVYFTESWGNRTRVDYGSGMELNFLCWLFCLQRLGVVQESDHTALVVRVFWRYVQVMRVLQSSYWLEPAGSHGVWGLDDYHFLPFLFGSAQLRGIVPNKIIRQLHNESVGHKYIRPKSIHDADVVEEYSKYYMYLACIKFINSIKTASLRWHSPMLDDISGVKTWEKVNSGMIKMYLAEVLGKLPVVQHFLFGSILPFPGGLPPQSQNGEQDAHSGPGHGERGGPDGAGWGDCCGIPLPSAFGAAAESRNDRMRLQGPAIRPVPFD